MNFEEIWDNDGFLSSCSRADAEHFYNEGQQAKIDELQKLRSLDEMEINQLAQANQVWQIKCDKLQARVDEALNMLCKLQYSSGERIYNDVGNILKGNKDEN